MLTGSSPCTDLSLVVCCDYVNERVNVKLALSFCTTWLPSSFIICLLTLDEDPWSKALVFNCSLCFTV